MRGGLHTPCGVPQVVLLILVWQHDVALNSPVITAYQARPKRFLVLRFLRLTGAQPTRCHM